MMTIALLLLLGTAMLSAKWRLGGFFDDYLDKDRCNAVKGIFIMLVFLSHFSQYVAPGARLAIDAPYYVFRGQMGQFVVALFLFYSGFGVMVSMKKGGKRYVDAMPRRRVLPTLLNFDIAVLCYFVLAALTHADIGAKKVFLSLVAWNSLGNSNWYIFAILLCYMVTWAAARFFDEENSKVLLSSGGVVLLLIIALSFFKKSYWYNTMLCYVAGMVYAHYRLTLEKVIKRNYWLCVFAVLCVLVLSRHMPWTIRGLVPNIGAVAFSVLCLMLTMKIQVRSGFLTWCGANLFALYIYQRIPMIALHSFFPMFFDRWYVFASLPICLLVSMVIAFLYPRWRISFAVAK